MCRPKASGNGEVSRCPTLAGETRGVHGLRPALLTWGAFVLFSVVEGRLAGHDFSVNLRFGLWTGAVAAVAVLLLVTAFGARRRRNR